MTSSSWILIGEGTLLAGCGDILLGLGQRVAAVVTREGAVEHWASQKGIRVERSDSDLPSLLRGLEFDHLASIAYLSMIPPEALRQVSGLAVNFHDGPLPRLAGRNVTSWAILRHEKTHGVTWHAMTERADAGRILEQRLFDVTPDETAFMLNAKCYAAGLESFAELARRVAAGDTSGREQDLAGRNYFGRRDRPPSAAVIDWQVAAEDVSALVRALDFGPQANPLCVPKIFLGEDILAVSRSTVSDRASGLPPGTVVAIEEDALRVATRTADVVLGGLAGLDGMPVTAAATARRYGLAPGTALPEPPPALLARLTELQKQAARFENTWRAALGSLSFPDLDLPARTGSGPSPGTETAIEHGLLARFLNAERPNEERIDVLVTAIAVFAARRSGASTFDLAYGDIELSSRVDGTHGAFPSSLPLHVTLDRAAPFAAAVAAVSAARQELHRRGPHAADLWAREPGLREAACRGGLGEATLSVGVGVEPPPARLRFALSEDASQCRVLADDEPSDLASQLAAVIAGVLESPDLPIAQVDLMTAAARARVLRTWNDTARPVPDACIHELVSEQAKRTPDATALVFFGRRMSFRELDERTNRLARHLRGLGVEPGALVGVFLQRSLAMVEAVLGTLKAGGAYVPLDPTYPHDRLSFMAEDAGLRLILTEESLRPRVPACSAALLCLDSDEGPISRSSADPLEGAASSSDLAYVIYTSGSTGRPKGVMVEHGNVANFAVGMDEHLDCADPKTWLAVTSLSFDISVLELLWTLSRGFTVVLHRDEERESFVAAKKSRSPVDFSLFFFSSDESEHPQGKYRLLLEGARFADRNGFVAVWTPERHFHAFGGLFPNPSVTSAAVAAITERVGIRAGSVVSPLHSPLRIAEEWSVVDNLSNGRVAISFAPGWQPNDFVLRPESFAARKQIMLDQIETVRRLWRGEALPFVNASGENVDVRILPRPIQKELPVWLTIAGNPESFVAAARVGANVLTHLLGQTVQEVADRVALYRRTWREAGHSGIGIVTMMVHSFVGDSDDAVKDVVRAPMKEYLRSAVGLVREAAWSFPTFKTKTTNASGEFDADSLSHADMDALLDHAFERYYSTSGLFGSVETCCRFVEGLRDIDVDEVACLVDFGVPTEKVLAHLPRLAEVARVFRPDTTTTRPEARPSGETIPSLIETQGVTHLQCTPTMAAMLLQDDASRRALGRLRQMLVGGETLPASLARDLAFLVGGTVTNVYGPTETTVWSSAARVPRDASSITIGHPIANTSLHVIDRDGRLAPVGLAGELQIGGKGVVRGYWNRSDLTSERFVPNPFGEGRLYRTGDLVRRRPDGALEFLGRLDHQVKVRGHRIELGEIEARLQEHPAVREAVVVARDDGAGPDLVAYVVTRNGPVDDVTLRRHLRDRLPEYMMPRVFATLASLPMTPNRKIDRKALPAPRRDPVVVAPGARPDGGLEATIAVIWCEVMELADVGVDTNFADVGGHSLAMVQVLGRLKERVHAGVTLVDLFRYTTIRTLAGHLAAPGKGGPALEASASRAASRLTAAALQAERRHRPGHPK